MSVRARRAKPRERQRWLEAHSALRRSLGRQLDTHPRHLKFGATAAGKPYIAEPTADVHFSLSQSGANSLIAVAAGRAVGVDIELEQRMSDFLEVALQIATPRKTSLLMSRSGGQLRAAFFDLWTRKEALLKAARTGLLSDPRDVSFEGRNWTLDSLVGSAPAQALPWQSRGC